MRNWMIRGLCLAVLAVSLGGCVIVPERGFHRPAPVYYYR
jgi:hypothetical protein